MHIAKQSTRGGVVLLIGSTIQSAAAAVAVVIILRLLGPSESGLFALVVVPAGILQLFLGLGVSVALTRNVAYYTSLGEMDKAVRFAKNAITFTLLTGLALAAFGFIAAGPISTILLHRASLGPYVALVSIIEVGQAVLQAGVAAAIGWNAMGLASVANIAQAMTRLLVSPVLIVVGFGLGGAVIGYASSYLLGGFLVLALLYSTRLRSSNDSLNSFASDVREMIRFGFPPYVGGVLSGLSVYYVPLVLALIADNMTIGYFAAANAVTIPISLLSSAAAATLFPAFAGLDGIKGDLAGAFRRATKYVGYLAFPTIFFLVLVAKQLILLLYGTQFVTGTGFLQLLSLASLPIVIGQGIIPSFFNGIGRTRITLITIGSAAGSVFILAPLMSVGMGLGVDGTIYAIFLSNLVLAIVGLFFFRAIFSSMVSLKPTAAALGASVAAYAIAYLLPGFESDLITIVSKLAVFGFVYFTLGPAVGSINLYDLDLVQRSVGDMPIVGRVAAPVFKYEKLVASHALVRASPE